MVTGDIHYSIFDADFVYVLSLSTEEQSNNPV